jgi:DHA2 family methylenomycin A resistance protein-like MFS transporter
MHPIERPYLPIAALTPRRPLAAALPLVLITTCLGVFLAQLDTSVVNLALKQIGAELGSSITQLQWVVDGYNLAYAAFLLTGGTLGDIFGRRRLFMIGVALFTAGSLICGIAPDNATMIAGRTLTGLGAAFEMPTSLAILSDAYPDAAQRARAIGVWASCNGLAWVVGPTMGGVIVGHVGWRWIFLLAVPIGLLASVLCLGGVPKSRCQNGRSVDAPGQILAVSMLGTLSVAFIEGPHWGWSNLATIGCLAAAACSFVGFAIVEIRTECPLLPLTIFRSRAFFAASLAAAGMTFGMYAMLFLMPLYLQTVQGASATAVGVQMLPVSLAFFLVSLKSGRLATRFGARLIMTWGLALMGLGLLALSMLSPTADIVLIEFAFLSIGVGLGFNAGPLLSVAVSSAPKAHAGAAAGVVNTARMIGATLGVAVLGAIFAAHAGKNPVDPQRIVAGLHPAFVGGALSEILGALAAWRWIPRGALRVMASARPTLGASGRGSNGGTVADRNRHGRNAAAQLECRCAMLRGRAQKIGPQATVKR